jgi:UDP-N-acetylmuramate dehydrogenase
MDNSKKLKVILGNNAIINEPLLKHTFLKIGGPADIFYEAPTTDDFKKAVVEARKLEIPVTILGEGSNVLISDEGIRGLVLIDRSDKIEILDKDKVEVNLKKVKNPDYRWESDDKIGTFKYEFKDLDYDESENPRIRVRMDSGVNLPKALDYLLEKGITGLQWYAGIPGTIGGAIFNNIHGGTHFLSEIIDSVTVLDISGGSHTINIEEMGVDYDKSRFQETGEIILDATFLLFKGDIDKAKYVRFEWAKRKSLQPRNAPGCAFHNLTQEQKDKLGIPTTSAGFIIEHLLKMTGFRIGDAAISKNHHNFIVNNGSATADDYLQVMKTIYNRAKKELGIEMVPEIFLLGFEKNEIKEFIHPRQIELRKKRSYEIRNVYKDSKKLFKLSKLS